MSFFCIGCGGTSLNYGGSYIVSVTSYINETGWSGSNGGYSTYFNRPSYQNGIQSNSKRGVPDLSADAYPNSGYIICYKNQASCYNTGGL